MPLPEQTVQVAARPHRQNSGMQANVQQNPVAIRIQVSVVVNAKLICMQSGIHDFSTFARRKAFALRGSMEV